VSACFRFAIPIFGSVGGCTRPSTLLTSAACDGPGPSVAPVVRSLVPDLGAVISSRRRQAPALLLLFAAVFIAAGAATADPTKIETKQAEAQQVLAQIHLIDAQLEQAAERYNLANIQLANIDAELKSNARHLVIAKSSLKGARHHLSERLVSIYVNGDRGSALEVLFGAENLDDLMNRMDAIDRVSEQDARILRDVRRFKSEVLERKARLTKARAAQARVVAERAAERQSIEGQLASRQRLLDSIKGEIASLQAAEARRQAELRRQAEARIEAAAAAARAQRQASIATPEALLDELPIDVEPTLTAPPSPYGGVVGIAMQYLGVPYVWGGSSPAGFDCSGFTMFVFAQLGVSLPHHAASQFGMGVPVSRDQLQPGDLVFFNGLGHIGIYIGGGAFIHAPHTGDVVKISSLNDSWYAATYVGARRIL
jgi:peptidoglycan DL-endopeptidase CwlO